MRLCLRRRDFVAGLGAAVWPLAVRAESAMPVVGVLINRAPGAIPQYVDAFRRGLGETGYVEGQNVAIVYRWPEEEGRFDRFRELAADLVRRRVAVIATLGGNLAAQTAKAATATIPIVFGVGEDPVKLGLVASLARPGGNATGTNFFVQEVEAKRLGLVRELVPKAVRVQSGQCPDCRGHVTRGTRSCTCPWTADSSPQRQYQPRDRGGL